MLGGDTITSSTGRFVFSMQSDGNAVLRTRGNLQQLWTSNTGGNPGAKLTVQTDGHVVIQSTSNAVLWKSGNYGTASRGLTLQDDGNLVEYVAGGNEVIWATMTSLQKLARGEELRSGELIRSENGAYTLQMQADGNLVLRNGNDIRFNSGTQGNPGAFATFQADGNFVIQPSRGAPAIWNTGLHDTVWTGVTNDGYLKKTNAAGASLWQRPNATIPTPVDQWQYPVTPLTCMTSYFGQTNDTTAHASGHKGIDLSTGGSSAQRQYAVSGGTVIESRQTLGDTYGYFVRINHGNGVVSLLGHLRSPSALTVGQVVQKGDFVGISGRTGTATGDHVHLGIYINGAPNDPVAFLSAKGLPAPSRC